MLRLEHELSFCTKFVYGSRTVSNLHKIIFLGYSVHLMKKVNINSISNILKSLFHNFHNKIYGLRLDENVCTYYVLHFPRDGGNAGCNTVSTSFASI